MSNLSHLNVGRWNDGDPLEDLKGAFARTKICSIGVGSIGSRIAVRFAPTNISAVALIDYKSYRNSSVASQCKPEDVGRRKVDVVGEQMRELGGKPDRFHCDAAYVPRGVVDSETIVTSSGDNRRCELLANRWALAMGARFVKINIEPTLNLVAIRAFDYRQNVPLCGECHFTAGHYERQRHPNSCDDVDISRSTNSPRALAEMCGSLGWALLLSIIADNEESERWFGREWSYSHDSGQICHSTLTANPNCRCDHQRRWADAVRLDEGPRDISLRDLLERSGAGAGARSRLRFCQGVSLRGLCRRCHRQSFDPVWLGDPALPIGQCAYCEGDIEAIPYWTYRELTAAELRPVVDLPLSRWRVAPRAVIEITPQGDDPSVFVVGKGEETMSQ